MANSPMGSVGIYDIHGELVIMVSPNGDKPSSREPLKPPQRLVKEPQLFVDDLVRGLGGDAFVPVHPTTPKVLYAGTPSYGYVLTIKPAYRDRLMQLLYPEG